VSPKRAHCYSNAVTALLIGRGSEDGGGLPRCWYPWIAPPSPKNQGLWSRQIQRFGGTEMASLRRTSQAQSKLFTMLGWKHSENENEFQPGPRKIRHFDPNSRFTMPRGGVYCLVIQRFTPFGMGCCKAYGDRFTDALFLCSFASS
jgi:hypothetical protein